MLSMLPGAPAASARHSIYRSLTLRPIGPTWSKCRVTGAMPSTGNSPYPGFRPQTPQNAAGRIIEPPVCVPSAAMHIYVATAAALPLDDPPGVRFKSHGFRVGGGSKPAHSVVTVLPKMITPAFRNEVTTGASRVAT